ncbi:MAG: hypothetical protein CME43_10475 [Haliea sp.]|uniref:hypothetical protein n=1 Tax=Haliea sp. TaxID=1932666 RepID=UPI000C46FFA6|nr:hypothetical protein [Haliea sp.]MBM69890.1 hypothetical protein [Haliea sp.]|tara:strand:+ start:6019 stop:7125 length:1107 start_codon:yes stop_codon:yes gene_type:complete
MATVYLHIGAPKTATSSLQAMLAAHHDDLLAAGILYPATCRHGDAHHVLVADLIDKYQANPMPDIWYGDFPRGQAWSRLRAELAAAGPTVHTAIVSSELFFGQSINIERMLGDIQAALAGHDVRVLMYLRRQDQLYASFYNQDVKGARQWPGSAYEFYETHQIFQRDYDQVVDMWGAAFGHANLRVRPFEPAQWPGGDMVKDFCQVTGLPPLRAVGAEPNDGLGANQLYIKRCLNHMGYDKADNDRVVGLLLNLCKESPLKSVRYVNMGCYGRLRERWTRTNQRLGAVVGDGGNFFQAPVPEPAAVPEYALDRALLGDFLQRLLAAGLGGHLGSLRGLFARAALLVIAEQGLWDAVSGSDRVTFESWV